MSRKVLSPLEYAWKGKKKAELWPRARREPTTSGVRLSSFGAASNPPPHPIAPFSHFSFCLIFLSFQGFRISVEGLPAFLCFCVPVCSLTAGGDEYSCDQWCVGVSIYFKKIGPGTSRLFDQIWKNSQTVSILKKSIDLCAIHQASNMHLDAFVLTNKPRKLLKAIMRLLKHTIANLPRIKSVLFAPDYQHLNLFCLCTIIGISFSK